MTGQRHLTLRYLNLTVDLNQPRVREASTATERGVRWASRYFEYPVTQLLDLRPFGPVTRQAPFTGEPPPNILVGYYYVIKALNVYLFDQRTVSNISYTINHQLATNERGMVWQVLTDSSYTINTGAFSAALGNSDDVGETIQQIQNAVMMDRVMTSLNINPIAGLGAVVREQEANRTATFTVRPNFSAARVSNRDAVLLTAICKCRKALINFLTLSRNANTTERLNLPLEDGWLQTFVERFSELAPGESGENMINDFAHVMTIGKDGGGLRGGALTLRSGTRVGLPLRLRPRENRRAVTATMRRRRGEAIRRFVDSLPVRTRRRRAAAARVESEAEEEEDDERPGPSGLQSREPADDNLPESDESPSRDEAGDFNQEVIETVAELIETLEQELRPDAEGNAFFNFGTRMYGLLLQLNNENRLTYSMMLTWLQNFFILEHVASTLYYLNERFVRDELSRRNVGVQFAQVVVRGRSDEGAELFTRLWFNRDRDAFRILYDRIVSDFIYVTENSDTETAFLAEEEREQLLAELRYSDNSGSVEDVIAQIRARASYTDSVEISFRIKFSGLVGYSQNPVVQRSFDQTRREAVRRWRDQQPQ